MNTHTQTNETRNWKEKNANYTDLNVMKFVLLTLVSNSNERKCVKFHGGRNNNNDTHSRKSNNKS